MKLTRAQAQLLALAARSHTGNPWPLISMSQRGGGAKTRMFDKMKRDGLFDLSNCITEAGLRALAAEDGGE